MLPRGSHWWIARPIGVVTIAACGSASPDTESVAGGRGFGDAVILGQLERFGVVDCPEPADGGGRVP